jgi:hypothetical protein
MNTDLFLLVIWGAMFIGYKCIILNIGLAKPESIIMEPVRNSLEME